MFCARAGAASSAAATAKRVFRNMVCGSIMTPMKWRTAFSVTLAVALLWTTAPARGQAGAPKGEWPTYGGDLGHTRYAPLDQINASNFNHLEIAWRFHTESFGPRPEYNFASTP